MKMCGFREIQKGRIPSTLVLFLIVLPCLDIIFISISKCLLSFSFPPLNSPCSLRPEIPTRASHTLTPFCPLGCCVPNRRLLRCDFLLHQIISVLISINLIFQRQLIISVSFQPLI